MRVMRVTKASLLQVLREKRSAESPEAPASDTDISKLPPVARDMYEKAKYDIIYNILRNF